jgi:hypothetical protein
MDEEVGSLVGERYARGGRCGDTVWEQPGLAVLGRSALARSGCRGYEASGAGSCCVPMRRCRGSGEVDEVLLRWLLYGISPAATMRRRPKPERSPGRIVRPVMLGESVCDI